jgi:hypothetical protein
MPGVPESVRDRSFHVGIRRYAEEQKHRVPGMRLDKSRPDVHRPGGDALVRRRPIRWLRAWMLLRMSEHSTLTKEETKGDT